MQERIENEIELSIFAGLDDMLWNCVSSQRRSSSSEFPYKGYEHAHNKKKEVALVVHILHHHDEWGRDTLH